MNENVPTILAVDDNADALYALERILAHNGYRVLSAKNGKDAIEKARLSRPAVILLDIMMPEVDGYEVTRQLKQDGELRFIPVILVSAKDSLDDIVRGLNLGADGYITKPFKPEELLARLRAALRMRLVYEELKSSETKRFALARELSSAYRYDSIVGDSPAIKKVFSLLEKIKSDESVVLITGPSGTGKELVARAIHFNSKRSGGAFVAKNCAAFTEQLLESELFGHTKGAFTGAVKDSKGLFEAADGGTFFLDEIGELEQSLQAKLLRVLQDGTFTPVGSTEEKKVDVRILAATNRDLMQMVKEGSFREDLYYRLHVFPIDLPALVARKSDIPLLVSHFLRQGAERRGETEKVLSEAAIDYLKCYSWPGNIRELENEVERMLILGQDDEVLDADVVSSRIIAEVDRNGGAERVSEKSLRRAVEDLERQMIRDTLMRLDGNKSNAAKELGMSRSNLIQKVRLYKLENN